MLNIRFTKFLSKNININLHFPVNFFSNKITKGVLTQKISFQFTCYLPIIFDTADASVYLLYLNFWSHLQNLQKTCLITIK